MNRRTSTICSRPSRGLTLVEVVAAIAILGTVLVGVVVSKARHTHQLALARRRTAAVRAADALIAAWWTSPEGVPVDENGPVAAEPTLLWETRVVDNPEIRALGARVVRVTFRPATVEKPAAKAPDEALLTVDLVLPEPPEEDENADEETEESEGGHG